MIERGPGAGDVTVSSSIVRHRLVIGRCVIGRRVMVIGPGHVRPDDERSLVDWPALGRLRGTLVLLMAVERIAEFAAVLIEYGRPADTPVAVVQDGTLRIQRAPCPMPTTPTVHFTRSSIAAVNTTVAQP